MGGPQEIEVRKMLRTHADSLSSDSTWLDVTRQHLQHSGSALEQAFARFE